MLTQSISEKKVLEKTKLIFEFIEFIEINNCTVLKNVELDL